jgi:hypothetical protein
MMRRTAWVASAIALVVSMGVIGCGGDSSSSESTVTSRAEGPTDPAAEYRQALEPICAKLLDPIRVGTLISLTDVVNTREAALGELRALVPPPELEAAHEALLVAQGKSLPLAREMADFTESTGWNGGPLPALQRANLANAVALNIASKEATDLLGVECQRINLRP